MKLLTKFILFFTLLFASLAVATMAYFEYSVRGSFKEQILYNLHAIAEENESTYFAFIGQLKTLAINWSSDNYIKELAERIVDPSLTSRARAKATDDFGIYLRDKKMLYNKSVTIVDILDERGVIVASSRNDRIGIDESKEEQEFGAHYFSKTINAGFGEAFIRSIVFEKDEETEPMFHVTTRLFSTEIDDQGNFIPLPAVLLVHFVSLPQLSDLLQGANESTHGRSSDGAPNFETSETYLVNKDRLLVTPTRFEPNVTYATRIITEPVEECFQNGKEMMGEYLNYREVPVFGVSMCIMDDGLVLVKEISAAEAYALYDDLRRKSTAVGGSIFFLIIIITFFVFRKPLSNIALFARAAERIARGDFTVRAPEDGKDEVGTLARAFNIMTARLKSLYGSLETKVAERTRQVEIEKAKDEALLQSIGDGIIATNEKGEIIKVNRAAEKMFKWDEKELLGKIFPKMIPAFTENGKEIPIKDRPVFTVLKERVSASLMALFVKKDGTRFPVSAIVNPVLINGKLVGTVAAIRDITKEKEIEKMRLDLLSLASHQLRTPLSGTKWLIETLRKGIHGELGKEQGEYLDEIYKINERMTGLVSDMLSVIRLESGLESSTIEPVPVPALFESLAGAMSSEAGAKHIAIRFHPDENILLYTAPKFLENILENFIANAIIYSPENTEIVVSAHDDHDFVIFSVEDSGIGIPQDEQAGIFGRFYRATNARTVNTRGSGLGLYITSILAEKIGAKAYFVSEVGKGSTFFVRVPKSPRKEGD